VDAWKRLTLIAAILLVLMVELVNTAGDRRIFPADQFLIRLGVAGPALKDSTSSKLDLKLA
jgi:hypothetical protein